MTASLRSIRRGLAPENDVWPGDVVMTLEAYGPNGIAAALHHVLQETFTGGYRVLEILPGPMIPKPQPRAAPEAVEVPRLGPGKILRPAPQPGVVGQPTEPVEMVQRFTIVLAAAGVTVPQRVVPVANPKNSPNGDPHKH